MPLARWRVFGSSLALLFLLGNAHLFWLSPSSSLSSPIGPNQPPSQVAEKFKPLDNPNPAPKITIIALWGTRESWRPNYLDNFFASVKENPLVDLLLVKFDKYNTAMNCEEKLSANAANVREICMTVSEYWDLHVEFLCERWKCTLQERTAVAEKIRERGPGDYVNSNYRPFRAAIFKKWMNPEIRIWGWCDLDIMLGNFERTFPWDVAEDYDLLVPGAPTNGDDILLYLPGHLMFFKHADSVVDEFMMFPNLKDVNAYLTLPWVGYDTEESEYSHFAFTNPRLTFLRFEAMVLATYHISSPGTGVYNIENEALWDLWTTRPWPSNQESRALMTMVIRGHVRHWAPKATFTADGNEYEIELREGEWPHFTWFPKQNAIDFVTDHDKLRANRGRRYVYRKLPNGATYDRHEEADVIIFKPPNPSTGAYNLHSRPFLRERLYNHFQIEKHREWWSLPDRALKSNELLLINREEGAQMWDFDGEVHFDTAPASR